MSIDFHEPTFSKETFDGPELEIVRPEGKKNWSIAFDVENLEMLQTYDTALNGVLHIEMLAPHLDLERSTNTHHVWELGDDSLLKETPDDIQDYLIGIITRTKESIKQQRITAKAA